MLICIMAVMPVMAAESVEALSYEQQREYYNNALSIQTENQTTISGGAYDWGRPGGYVSSYASGSTVTEWYPYQGAQAISRADFFDTVGAYDLAEAEKRIDESNSKLHIAGAITTGVGLAAALAGLIWGLAANMPYEDPTFWASMGLLIGGTCATVVGVPLLVIETKSDISISFAVGLADSYNKQLLESM